MKKVFVFLVAGVMALSVVVGAAPAAKGVPAKKEAASKPRVLTGPLESIDAAAGAVTVKGRKETVTLKAAEGVRLDDFKVGDRVTVAFKGDALSKIVKPKDGKPASANGPKAAKSGAPALKPEVAPRK